MVQRKSHSRKQTCSDGERRLYSTARPKAEIKTPAVVARRRLKLIHLPARFRHLSTVLVSNGIAQVVPQLSEYNCGWAKSSTLR